MTDEGQHGRSAVLPSAAHAGARWPWIVLGVLSLTAGTAPGRMDGDRAVVHVLGGGPSGRLHPEALAQGMDL